MKTNGRGRAAPHGGSVPPRYARLHYDAVWRCTIPGRKESVTYAVGQSVTHAAGPRRVSPYQRGIRSGLDGGHSPAG